MTVKLDIDPAFSTGATIRYTTDGSDPSIYSPTYGGSITLYSSATVKARAFKSGLLDSFVNAAAYTVTGTPAVEFHLTSDNGSEFLKNDFPLVALSSVSGLHGAGELLHLRRLGLRGFGLYQCLRHPRLSAR